MSFTELNRYKIMTLCRADKPLYPNECYKTKAKTTEVIWHSPRSFSSSVTHEKPEPLFPNSTRSSTPFMTVMMLLRSTDRKPSSNWHQKQETQKKISGDGGVPIIKRIRVNMCFPEAPHLLSPFLVAPYLLFRHLWFCILSHAVWVGLASQPAPGVHSHLQALQGR